MKAAQKEKEMTKLTKEQMWLLEGFGIRKGMDEEEIRERMEEHRGEAGRYAGSVVSVGRRRVRVDGAVLSPAGLKKAME